MSEVFRDYEVHGEVQGDVRAARGTRLTIAEDANVHQNVTVEAGALAIIEGEVQGDVIAEGSVTVAPEACIHGNLSTSVPTR